MTYSSASRYRGEPRVKPCDGGQVEAYWESNGATYSGMWQGSRPHGKGRYVFPGKDDFTYEGNFVEGDRSGSGVCTFSNGRKYVGEWFRDVMHGMGALYGSEELDDFEEYTGPFVNGKRNGQGGTCRYRNGSVYRGEWLEDKRHGHGELELPKNASIPGYKPIPGEPHVTKYIGTFVDDAPKGAGILKYSDGSSYEGECDRLYRHGQGEHHLATGCVFKGTSEFDKRHGAGVLVTLDAEYHGEWNCGSLEGTVTIRGDKISRADPSSVYYRGPYVRGELTGEQAEIGYRDKATYTGAVRMGRPHGRGVLLGRELHIAGIGDFMLQYEGDFVAGVLKGNGEGIFVAVNADSTGVSEESTVEPRGFLPKYNFPGRYKGSWVDGLPCGEGEWIWERINRRYQGNVLRCLPHGEGTLTCATASYSGDFVHGLPEGLGKVVWLTGSSFENCYEGGWKGGYFDGEGLLKLHGGYTYSGWWSKGIMEGFGTEKVPYEQSYVGNFSNGKKNGEGKLFLVRTGETYEGTFTMGEVTGQGKMTTREGHVLKGAFEKGRIEGGGEAIHNCGTVFQGQFKNGIPTGSGRILYTHGDVYEGGVADSSDLIPYRDGPGVYTFFEGGKLECTWKRNVLIGDGIYTSSNGVRSRRSYTEGILDFDELIDKAEPSSSGDLTDIPPKRFSGDEKQLKEDHTSGSVVKVCRSLPPRKGYHASPSAMVPRGSLSMISGAPGEVKPENLARVEGKLVPLPPLGGLPHEVDGSLVGVRPFSRPGPGTGCNGHASPHSPTSPNSHLSFPHRGIGRGSLSVERGSTNKGSSSGAQGCWPHPSSPTRCPSVVPSSLSSSHRFPALARSAVKDTLAADPKENEIHRLTGSLQTVNERIRALKAKRSPLPSAGVSVEPGGDAVLETLQDLQEERRSALQDLSSLI